MEVVPRPPGPAGGHRQKLGPRAGREYKGPGGAGATPGLSPHAADPTEAAGQLRGHIPASRATAAAARVEGNATADVERGEGGLAWKESQPSHRHQPARTSLPGDLKLVRLP